MNLIDNEKEYLELIKKNLNTINQPKDIFAKYHFNNEDLVLYIRPLVSLLTTIANYKINNALWVINNTLHNLQFLNSFDDKYLSNIDDVITKSFWTEHNVLNETMENVAMLNEFLEQFLENLGKEEKNGKK